MTRTREVEFGHLNPIAPTRANVELVVGQIKEIVARTDALFLVENITTHMRIKGEMPFSAFYQAVCDEADCGLSGAIVQTSPTSANAASNACSPGA